MKEVPVILELEPHFLDQIKAIAKVDRRTLSDQASLLLEKGVCIFEMSKEPKQYQAVDKEKFP
jgi:hypothetical protein